MSEDYDYCEECGKLKRYVIGDNKEPTINNPEFRKERKRMKVRF